MLFSLTPADLPGGLGFRAGELANLRQRCAVACWRFLRLLDAGNNRAFRNVLVGTGFRAFANKFLLTIVAALLQRVWLVFLDLLVELLDVVAHELAAA